MSTWPPISCNHCGQTIAVDDPQVSDETLRSVARNHQRYCPARQPKGPAVPPATIPHPDDPAPRRPVAQQLLQHSSKAVARQAAKVLEEELKLTELWKNDLSAARIRSAIAEKEAELAALKAQLLAETTPAVADSKTIRAWAHSTGMACPTTGKLPQAVIDAYHAAHSAGAA